MLIEKTDEAVVHEIVFDEKQAGERLDKALSAAIDGISRNRVHNLLDEGAVSIASYEGRIDKNYRIRSGDIITVTVKQEIPLEIKSEDIPINIVFEDRDIIVVDKEKGMVVHPAHGNEHGTLVNALLYHIENNPLNGALSSINGVVRPGIVHRIDKNTSGLLVIAKNDAAHANLSAQLEEHTMSRKYVAIVHGGFREPEGTISAPLGRDPSDRKKYTIMPNGKRAITHYKVLDKLSSPEELSVFPPLARLYKAGTGALSVMELTLETGRTHQIRVHMKSLGHPVFGDDIYGPSGGDGQYLHAAVLGLVHPRTGEYMEWTSDPLWDGWSAWKERAGYAF
ncbi:MAG: RluA family pseudouridine synthase [Clostridiales Family XIII bacterium]|jgi:23S rRNA pseudouridine1911/1915/1917 synthase|nr:RluA family pseudouridine synthase [Clostridiales Family XIII bacterium]